MLHAFKHFIFGFKAAVFKPANNTASAKPETDFQYKENNAHSIKIKSAECCWIKCKLKQLDDEHAYKTFP